MAPKINRIYQVLMFLGCSGQVWRMILNNNNNKKNRSRDGWELCEILYFKKLPHSTWARAPGTAFWLVHNWALGLRGMYITSDYGLQIYGLHFFQLDQEFFCLVPSLARLYCAAASDGSLAIIEV